MSNTPNLKSLFATDANVETAGVEYPIVDGAGNPSGLYLRLARAGGANKRFDLAKERAYRQWRAKHGKKAQISDDQHVEILIPVFAETVIVGWFFEDPAFVPTDETPSAPQRPEIPFDAEDWRPYTPQDAEAFLRALPKSRLVDLMETAADYSAYRADLEDLAGN